MQKNKKNKNPQPNECLVDEEIEQTNNIKMQPTPTDDKINKHLKKIRTLMDKLKTTSNKNNFMVELRDLFNDNHFLNNIDKNVYLLGCENCVIDFKECTHRKGRILDYITKSTKLHYIPLNVLKEIPENLKIIDEITDFFEKIYPDEEIRNYMWNHLASCLLGITYQTFTIYFGEGSNGKSKIMELMRATLGDYYAIAPISLITEKRPSIGGTQNEIVKLAGCRLAVIQEPSKGMNLNEGCLKELTGNDVIQARDLFSSSISFTPQFKLVMLGNTLLEVNSDDNGTWRRQRVIKHVSTFVHESSSKLDDTKHIYKMDTTIESKIPIWAPVFLSMLVDIAFKTKGQVIDCKSILEESQGYRNKQDIIGLFIKDNVMKTDNAKENRIKKMELLQHFKMWFMQEYAGTKKQPKAEELYMAMTKQFGEINKNSGWQGVKLFYPENDDNMNK
jgi:P4 family phage/plasmid primase-like protien